MNHEPTIEDLDGNRWKLSDLKAVVDTDDNNLIGRYTGFRKSQLDELEYANADNMKNFRRVPTLFSTWTDGENIYKLDTLWRRTNYYDKKTDNYVTSEYVATNKRFWRHVTEYKVKERMYNGKPTLYWVAWTGIMIPMAFITAIGFLGPKPVGHTLKFLDDDYQNTKPENLRWVLKTKPDGRVRYVSYDKSKKKFRLSHPTLPRKCFNSEEDAVNYLKSQQVTVQYVGDEDTKSVDPVIIMPDVDSSDDEPVADDDKIIHI